VDDTSRLTPRFAPPRRAGLALALGLALLLLPPPPAAQAEVEASRFSAGGYFRIMTRPDLQGGDGRLGFWNLYGRLMNEGPYAALELKLDLVPRSPTSRRAWTSVHARIEGGTVANAHVDGGRLDGFRLTQLYAQAGNVLFDNVTWQLGTLDSYFGDLGLYDLRPAQIFFETVGLSARYDAGPVELLVGFGDSGWFVRRDRYSTILTWGASLRLRLAPRFELGFGGMVFYEPKVRGNRFAPHTTPGLDYEHFLRGEVIMRYVQDNPNALDIFPKPAPVDNLTYKGVFYLGFGAGPIRWNNLFARFQKAHPDGFVTERYEGRDFDIYVKELTDERYSLLVGNEMQISLVPDRLDLVWGLLFGHDWDEDNTLSATEFDRTYGSTVVRLQYYATSVLHLLLETSFAREVSNNGNMFRRFGDSVFQSTEGLSDARGLEFGDSRIRDTWQLKVGPVLNPLGFGVYTRPSLRVLYGLQWSSQINAFGNSFVESLDQFNQFGSPNQRWHHVLGLEVEAWF